MVTSVFGFTTAFAWGVAVGLVTSMPMGPTGGLVLGSASRGEPKRALLSALGLTLAQVLFYALYLFGFSGWLVNNPDLMQKICLVGIGLILLSAIQPLKRALFFIFPRLRAPQKELSENSPPVSFLSAKLRAPQRLFGKQGHFWNAFLIAITNPVILLFVFANVSFFVSVFPELQGSLFIATLLTGGVLGTFLWFALLTLFVARRSSRWSERHLAYCDLLSALLMLLGAVGVAAELIF